jgi:hypothetical protein
MDRGDLDGKLLQRTEVVTLARELHLGGRIPDADGDVRDRAPSVEQWEHRQLDADTATLALVDGRHLSRVEPERRQVDGFAGEGTSNERCLASLRREGVEQDVVFGRGLRLEEVTKCLIHE